MANITITSTTNSIKVEYGDYTPIIESKKQCWRKEMISNFHLLPDESAIHVVVIQEKEWMVSWDGSTGTLQIDSVNGVAPTSNSDLYDKLIALIV